MTDLLLEVKDLRTYFTTEEGVVRAVDGVSFDIHRGERFGVVGESGSGKSVTAMSIMGLIEPPAGNIVTGSIKLEGRDLLAMSDEEMSHVRGGEVAMIFQDPMTSLNPVFTVGDQLVETILLHRDVNKREARELAIQALDDVQIPSPHQRVDDYPHQFSGGMRQRAMIAMGLSCDPKMLIADEPTTALDVTTQAQIMDLMLNLADDRGTAVMLITHDLGVVAGFCDRIQVMYAGGIVERSSAEEIFYDTKHPYTYGLLGSMTRMDQRVHERLFSIHGSPPSLIKLPEGCRFRPRCHYAKDICRAKLPALQRLDEGHEAACHFATELDLTVLPEGVAG
jgi:oligopeptide transport system ATP-binding protein